MSEQAHYRFAPPILKGLFLWLVLTLTACKPAAAPTIQTTEAFETPVVSPSDSGGSHTVSSTTTPLPVATFAPSPSPTPAATTPPAIHYLEGSSRKICQLTGEIDRQTGEPTLNRTESRFGLVGTDLGASFEHQGKLVFLFGDTIGARRRGGGDSMAFSSDFEPEDCLALDFLTNAEGVYRSPEVPGITLGGFEVPTGGFSDGHAMYVFFTTDHSEAKVMGRSVLAVSRDEGQSFSLLYTVSSEKFINIAPVVVEAEATPGLPIHSGRGVLLWGSGTYRRSNPYLAFLSLEEVENPQALRYFAGLDESGAPRWSAQEAEAIPLFEQPCLGEISVAWNPFLARWMMLYNCPEPRGINLRVAEQPWGPWSQPEVIFNPVRDQGYCHFMHVSWQTKTCDSVHDPGRENTNGGEYGPYIIAPLTTGDDSGSTIYYTLSTWNPYNVMLMSSRITLTP